MYNTFVHITSKAHGQMVNGIAFNSKLFFNWLKKKRKNQTLKGIMIQID